jgi:acylphosphatase
MVDMIFFIEGEPKEIFKVGFRPAIMGSAAERGLKSAANNMPDENKVQVLVSGNHNMITSFHKQIKSVDIRIKADNNTAVKPRYRVTDTEEYNGPNIDWNGYQLSMMTEQMSKGFVEANRRLGSIESKLSSFGSRPKKPVKSAKRR